MINRQSSWLHLLLFYNRYYANSNYYNIAKVIETNDYCLYEKKMHIINTVKTNKRHIVKQIKAILKFLFLSKVRNGFAKPYDYAFLSYLFHIRSFLWEGRNNYKLVHKHTCTHFTTKNRLLPQIQHSHTTW